MTLTTPYSATFIVGDGVTKTFSYLFEEVSSNFIDVIVYNTLTGVSSTPTYTIDTDQKQVIFGDDTPAPTADDVVCIYRNTPVIQDVQFRTLHGYDAKTMENILSKIVAMIQEIESKYLTTDVLQGDPWQIDLLSSADDGATLNIDYTAKKFVKGLYFRITSGNLQVSADGSTYITMPKSTDVAEFRQNQIELPDHTYEYRLQYRVGSTWFDADSTAKNTADAAYNLAETVQTGLSAHVNNQNNPHQTTVAKLNDVTLTDLQPNQFLKYDGVKWVNVYSSATATWGGIVGNLTDQTDLKNALDGKVNIDGSSIMTAPLKFMAGSMRGAVGPYLNGVGFWKLDSQANLTLIATISDSQFVPTTTNAIDLGSTTKKWKDLYLSGRAYIEIINNKEDIGVPSYGGTMVVADFDKVSEGMFLRLDNNLHPVWEVVTLTTSLSSLTDVTITSATSGQVLTYDGSKWVNQAVPTPTINYSINGGNYTAGTGSYAITRFSLMLQKADGTWEKPTDTSANYSQATNKTVNTNGFLLNQILYYNNTGGVSGGQLTGLNKVYSKHATVPMSYSTNCGTAPGWALGTWIYLVGTLGADGLFYLDTTQWWSNALPNTNDGKLYIRLGPASSSTSDTVALLEDRPIFYHDGNGVKEYHPGGNGGNVSVGTSIDADIVGAPTISGSIVSNFSNTNYLVLPGVFDLGSASTASFEIAASFTTTSTADSDQKAIITGRNPNNANAAGIEIRYADFSDQKLRAVIISSITQTLTGTTNLSPNTKYYIKFEYDGTDYKLWLSTNGDSYSLEASATMSTLATPARLLVGTGGMGYTQSIDMADLYIKENGQIIWEGMDSPGLHQRVAVGHEVIEFQKPTAGNNYTWYRKYADGWVEQGGYATTSGNTGAQITLPVTMSDAHYLINGTCDNNTTGGVFHFMIYENQTTTGFAASPAYAGEWRTGAFYWEVRGMAA